MSKSKEEVSLQTLYTELNKHLHTREFKLMLKCCNKIIHSKDGKQEIEAMMCKIVCFIEMSQFAEALKFITATPEVQEHSTFEKAYCQYRMKNLNEALETINDLDEQDLRSLELKAQILYKLERYSECKPIYKKLMKESSDEMEDLRMTNFIAVHASLAMFENEKSTMKFEGIDSHEAFYNLGCVKLGEGDAEGAKLMFEKSEELCREIMNEEPDTTEEEVESELAPIRVQKAYTLQLLGKEDEAMTIYNQIIKSRPSDVALLAVASNNIITINRDQNMFDSRRRMKATMAKEVNEKLVMQQRKKLDFNRALLFMYSNQWESCKQLLKQMKSRYEGEELPHLINAAMLCREKGQQEGIDYLTRYMKTRLDDPERYGHVDFTNVKLALVQLMLQQKQLSEACALLESLEEICYQPAIVSLLVALYKLDDNKTNNISDLFDRAIEWNKLKKGNKDVLKTIMWKCSLFHLANNDNHKAAKVLEEMLSMDPSNVNVMAQLIFAFSKFNRERAHQISERLPSLQQLSIEVDVDQLEASASAPRYIKRQKEKLAAGKDASQAGGDTKKFPIVSERAADAIIKTKKKKKKKNPTPKNFQPDFVPDPERWIARRERSDYKGRRKDRRKGAVMKGSQGAASSSAADQFDMSAKPSTSGTSQATSSSAAAVAPSASSGTSSQQATPKPGGSRSQASKNKKARKKKSKW